jgi:hypothetical protein
MYLPRGSSTAIQGVQVVAIVRVPDLLTSNCDRRLSRSLFLFGNGLFT